MGLCWIAYHNIEMCEQDPATAPYTVCDVRYDQNELENHRFCMATPVGVALMNNEM